MNSDGDGVAEASFAEGGDSPSLAVVRAVAESEGVDPLYLPPLYHSVNSGVLDTLFGESGPAQVEFAYHGHEVEVLGEGRVVARKRKVE